MTEQEQTGLSLFCLNLMVVMAVLVMPVVMVVVMMSVVVSGGKAGIDRKCLF